MEFIKNIQPLGRELNSLDQCDGPIRLISTVPKSGTWAQKYFWSILDSLLAGSSSYDPHQVLYKPRSLACSAFGVNHGFCPGWRSHIEASFLEKIDEHIYPGTRGINWFQTYFDQLGSKSDPIASPDTKIALIYRNPLDQIFSYFRPRWSKKYADQKGLKWKRFPMPGMLQDKGQIVNLYDTPKETLRAGAVNSYCIQLATFVKIQQLAPENVALFKYEDVCGDRATHQRQLARFLDFDDGSQHFSDCFQKALELSDRSSLSNLETEKGHGINLSQDRDNGWKDKVHIRSGNNSDWREVFDERDVDYVKERLSFFDIPSALVSI